MKKYIYFVLFEIYIYIFFLDVKSIYDALKEKELFPILSVLYGNGIIVFYSLYQFVILKRILNIHCSCI